MVSIFCGDYFFLSNLYLVNLKLKDHVHKSAEHFYQAVKCAEKSDREKIHNVSSPKSAKILGRYLKERHFWDVDKVRIMEKILRLKFRKKKLRKLLQMTGNKVLTNQNFHHDTFWGVCGCTKHQRTGLNMLGKIIMKIRERDFDNLKFNE